MLFLFMYGSISRFPGFDGESQEFNAEVHRDHIFGKQIGEYMQALQDEDEEAFKRQFSKYIKEGISPENVRVKFTLCYTLTSRKVSFCCD